MVMAISIDGVVKRFGSLVAIDRIFLNVPKGEFFALLGANGAGKSTLINMMAGLSRPDQGTIRIMGHDVQRDYREARRALGVVPQELVFDPFFTVLECLQIQSGYFGIARNDDWIEHLLTELHLTDKANTNMRSLSGGMKRRVLVAQALVHRPSVIVLDEPTAGVDVALRQSLWKFIKNLNQEGHTILLTTHYFEEVEALCQRAAILVKGQLMVVDTLEALKAQYQVHSLEQAFMAWSQEEKIV